MTKPQKETMVINDNQLKETDHWQSIEKKLFTGNQLKETDNWKETKKLITDKQLRETNNWRAIERNLSMTSNKKKLIQQLKNWKKVIIDKELRETNHWHVTERNLSLTRTNVHHTFLTPAQVGTGPYRRHGKQPPMSPTVPVPVVICVSIQRIRWFSI